MITMVLILPLCQGSLTIVTAPVVAVGDEMSENGMGMDFVFKIMKNMKETLVNPIMDQIPKSAIDEISKAFMKVWKVLVEIVMPKISLQADLFYSMCQLPEWGICKDDDCSQCESIVNKVGDMLNPFKQSKVEEISFVQEITPKNTVSGHVEENQEIKHPVFWQPKQAQHGTQQLVQDEDNFVKAVIASCKQKAKTSCKVCSLLFDKKLEQLLFTGSEFLKEGFKMSFQGCEISFEASAVLAGQRVPITGKLSEDDDEIIIQGSSARGKIYPLGYPVSISNIILTVTIDIKSKTILSAHARGTVLVSVSGKTSSAALNFFWGEGKGVRASGLLPMEAFDVIPGVLQVNRGNIELKYNPERFSIDLLTSGVLHASKGGNEAPFISEYII